MFDSQHFPIFILFLTCVGVRCDYDPDYAVNGADQNSLADVKSNVEVLQEDLVEELGTKRGQEIKRHPQYVQGSDGCCSDIRHSLEDINSKLEDLRAKLGKQFEWSSSHEATCSSGFTYLPSTGSCYKVVYESLDWYSAGKKCQGLHRGSHLAAITSAEENNALKPFLASELSRNIGNTACIPLDYPEFYGKLFWTSGQQQVKNNCKSPFVWRTSSDKELSFGFTSWEGGEPNCGFEDICVQIWASRNFTWNDHSCSTQICPLCEYTL